MKSEGDCFLRGTPWQTQTMCWKSDTTLPTKIYIVKAVVFPVVMYSCELDNKEGRAPKNGCLQTVVLEKTPESVLDSMEIKPVSFEGNQPWILVRRTDAEDEAPVFWSSDTNRQLTGKVPDAGKDWGQKEKRASEDEMARWHHRCNGHELGQMSGNGERQEGLACCSPWWQRVRHSWMTEQQQCMYDIGGNMVKYIYHLSIIDQSTYNWLFLLLMLLLWSCVWLFCDPTIAHQGALSTEFPGKSIGVGCLVAFSFFRGSSLLRDWTESPAFQVDFLPLVTGYVWHWR